MVWNICGLISRDWRGFPIAHKAIFVWIIFLWINFLSFTLLWIIFLRRDHESIYLSINLGTSHLLRCRVGHHDTFHEVLGVFSEWMVKREELSMLVSAHTTSSVPEGVSLTRTSCSADDDPPEAAPNNCHHSIEAGSSHVVLVLQPQ